MNKTVNPVYEKQLCYHCGQTCDDARIPFEDKIFCCQGCRLVFEVINSSHLCHYYDIEKHPGLKSAEHRDIYDVLDEEKMRKEILEFNSKEFARVTFKIPAIHCISCVWLLENLKKTDDGILKSEVSFERKTVLVEFNPAKVRLGRIATILASLGYAPAITNTREKAMSSIDSELVLKVSIAGFCFGNVMLFSFPEYLGMNRDEASLQLWFRWLSVALSVPVLLFSAKDYFTSAHRSFKLRQINIDVPIAAGLLALFCRSVWEIATGFGQGYLDSFTGLVFFLLVGRWFQSKTYDALSFDRDFKSYFPLSVLRLTGSGWRSTLINELKKGDRIKIRNLEIIPADGILVDRDTFVDYSFVTGESKPQLIRDGGEVFAGGRVMGQPVMFMVEKETSQSHLTGIWNQDVFHKINSTPFARIIDRAARIFTWVVVAISLLTAAFWYWKSPADVWLIFTSVLMVACPCALALAAPFTYGSALRVFGRRQFYLKNAGVIEAMGLIDTIVFDKTGTITHGQHPEIDFHGILQAEELACVKLLTASSTHPLSSLISKSLHQKSSLTVYEFKEWPGRGVEGRIGGRMFRVGSASFVGHSDKVAPLATSVFVSVEGSIRGFFTIRSEVRKGMKEMLHGLSGKEVALISGDSEADQHRMEDLFGKRVKMLFYQSPSDKMDFVRQLQQTGKKVMMIGDGLNDAGALKQSDVGIAVSDDTAVFTPACDGIIKGDQVAHLDKFLEMSASSEKVLKAAFGISFFYNAIALGFAVTGHLSPLVAAILMPLSSISVVSFSRLGIWYISRDKSEPS